MGRPPESRPILSFFPAAFQTLFCQPLRYPPSFSPRRRRPLCAFTASNMASIPNGSSSPAGPAGPSTAGDQAPEPKKLILCFDGTGNEFSGSNADTNVVKLLHKLDRNDPNQYHYYQSECGTAVSCMAIRCSHHFTSWHRDVRCQRRVHQQVMVRGDEKLRLQNSRPNGWHDVRCPRHGWLPIPNALL